MRVFDSADPRPRGQPQRHDEGRGKVGLHGDTYYGLGYRYVMPQVASWVNAEPIGKRCDGAGGPVHSYLSIERSTVPDMLVSGEYCDRKGANGGRRRPARDVALHTTGAEPGDPRRTARSGVPRFVSGLPDSNIQGAAGATDNWWFTHTRRRRTAPSPGSSSSPVDGLGRRLGGHRAPDDLLGPEDLYCWRGRGQVWTVAEHARQAGAVRAAERPMRVTTLW